MIDKRNKKLSVLRQCELLDLNRTSYYYQKCPQSPETLMLMRRIDELYTKSPFFGARKMRDTLMREGWGVCRKRIRRLMKIMGLEAQCPKPDLSKPNQSHKKYPYLLRNLNVSYSNQVWCTDITYIRLSGGFVYMIAVMDWYSRKILSWRLSNTLDVHFCLEALDEAFVNYEKPEIFNTDQGSQFTSNSWIEYLENKNVAISMDGRGRALDNVFVERFWRSLKYEEVYRREYVDYDDAYNYIKQYVVFYNTERPHSSHGIKTPDEAYLMLKAKIALLNLDISIIRNKKIET